MNWLKIFKNKKSNTQIDIDIYEDKSFSEYNRYIASINIATEYWNEKGYSGIALPDKPFSEDKICYVYALNREDGMFAYMIHKNDLDKYLNFKFPEYKAFLRDEKLRQLGL